MIFSTVIIFFRGLRYWSGKEGRFNVTQNLQWKELHRHTFPLVGVGRGHRAARLSFNCRINNIDPVKQFSSSPHFAQNIILMMYCLSDFTLFDKCPPPPLATATRHRAPAARANSGSAGGARAHANSFAKTPEEKRPLSERTAGF